MPHNSPEPCCFADTARVAIQPLDRYNQTLRAQVHPPDWINPQPQPCYDLVVIGAGTAGLVAAAGAAGLDLGLKVALIEQNLMGGDCLNVGCVPSKTVIRSARAAAELRNAAAFGLEPIDRITVNFAAVMERMRRIRADISPHDSAARFQKLGIDVFFGSGQFAETHAITVDNQILRYKKAVIATGARPAKPTIPGIEAAGYLTNETVFSLTDRPQRLAVIGGGTIGCELAQAFQRLGSEVVLLHRGSQLLNKQDPDAAELLQQTFEREGIRVVLNCQPQRVTQTRTGKLIEFTADGRQDSIAVDEILVGIGRTPNVESLNLPAAGVAYDLQRGVWVNDYLQTTNPQIYAAGDVCMDCKFTHAADAAARIVIKNALFSPFGWGRSKLSRLVIPRTTYTDPEIAQVGLSAPDAQEGIAIETLKIPLSRVDRALADGETEGFVKILHPRGSDRILGATIVARHAGEMISEITLAIVSHCGLNTLSTVIHPYPTQAEAIKKAADAYRRTLLTPQTKRLLKLLTKFA
jgi:pyruvate/2-oxoglutarate dehydrogenase complex dihydrolipoamide dehydrogenase (E3) component